ncbi:MAG: type I restriction enzyme HsdR N-terminal domain-containing protein [Chlamydiales bacterium]
MRHLKEELVRQQLLNYLADVKQFPRSLIVQERKISTLPNTIRKCHLNRRADLLIYTPEFKPLLLIECKAVAITPNAMKQVLGYNYYIGAPCIGIINQQKCILQWKKDHSITHTSWQEFPSYATCMNVYLKYV